MATVRVIKPFMFEGKRVEEGDIITLDNSSDKVSRIGDILNSGKAVREDPEAIKTRGKKKK